jgi:hypothetical protein
MKQLFCSVFLVAFSSHVNATLSDCTAQELCDLGKQSRVLGNYPRALSCFRAASAKAPDSEEVSLELALAHLACEHFNKGFELLDNHFRKFSPLEKQWHGQNLEGKRILIHTPAWGFGDLFMFLRFARGLRNQGATVVIFADNVIIPFLQIQNYIADTIIINNCVLNDSYFGHIVIVERNKLPAYDYEAHLWCLPALMKVTAKSIPQMPYIQADQARVQHWADQMKRNDLLKIGICWQGASRNDEQLKQRSMPFECFTPLLEKKGCRFYNLQTGHGFEEINAEQRQKLIILDEQLDAKSGAFVDTAAIIENLDLVITIDTSIAHLAGAMGKKVFVMLPFAADWRYHAKRTDSPWYPTMQLFRQSSPGDWISPIQIVSSAIDALVGERNAKDCCR